jgi:drug/metabolite transporter (DMT)-like permease
MAEGLRSIGPSGVAFVRISIGFLTLALFPAARKPVERADWGSVAWLGLLWFAFPLSMFPFAEQRVSSALTGMLNGANPLFANIVAAYILRRAPARGVAAGLAVGLTGVLMAIPALDEGHSSPLGVWMILAALIAYGFAPSIARSLQQKYGAARRSRSVQSALVARASALSDSTGRVRNGLCQCAHGLGGGPLWSGARFGLHVPDPRGSAGARNDRYSMNRLRCCQLSVAGGMVCLIGAWLMKRAATH